MIHEMSVIMYHHISNDHQRSTSDSVQLLLTPISEIVRSMMAGGESGRAGGK